MAKALTHSSRGDGLRRRLDAAESRPAWALAAVALALGAAYLALPLWFVGVALLLTRLPQRVALTIVVAVVISLNAWALHRPSHVQTPAPLLQSR